MAFVASKGPSVRNSPANASPSMLQKLGKKTREFNFVVYKILNLKNVPSDMQTEHRALVAALGAMNRSVGASYGGLKTMASWAGLSALPLIPIAVAAGIFATLVTGLKLANDFQARFDARRADADRTARESGRPYEAPDETASDSPFSFDFGGKYVLPILAIGAAWFFFGRK